MRYALLVAIMVVACLLAVLRPKIGLLFYLWFAIVRPDTLAWAPDSGFSMMLGTVTLIGSLRYVPRLLRMLINPWVWLLVLLWLLCLISTVLAVAPDLSYRPFFQFSRMLVMALAIPLFISSVEDVKWCVWVIGGSLGFIGAKLGFFGLIHGGVRYAAGYSVGGFLGDNNTVALAMVMGLPLCWYAFGMVKQLWAKLMFGSMCFLLLAGIVMCHSRGGVLATGVVALVIALRSKRKLLTLALLTLFSIPSVFLVRSTFFERMETLARYEEDSSAYGRLVYAKAAIDMWRDYPLTGVGFGTHNEMRLLKHYVKLEKDPEMVIHNTYLQMLADSGIFAFAVYVILLFGALFWLEHAVRRTRRMFPEEAPILLSLQTALVGFMVGCTFLSRVDFDLTYMLLMTMAAWQMAERLSARPQVVPATEAVQPPKPALAASARTGISRTWPR